MGLAIHWTTRPHEGGDWQALGSAYEVAAAVDAAAALGVADKAAVSEVLALCDRVSAMLSRMR